MSQKIVFQKMKILNKNLRTNMTQKAKKQKFIITTLAKLFLAKTIIEGKIMEKRTMVCQNVKIRQMKGPVCLA